MAYEALYRRYRPSRFGDAFFGQAHVVAALRNAVEGDRVGHAYLFSGPRGTGKTTSARILAKALNCTNLQGGEPCDECDSCEAFNSGSSYDLHELDAASNNGVDAMRDLIGKVALGSPGRTKVYILDEVHMLSSGAENALLKTLEEPPPHVVFVLCTTEPNKVVPTIRSRTQHLEFSLLNQTEVAELIDYVVADAGLEISDEDRAYVARAGGGSARDTLSALDQVVAAGGAPRGGEHLDELFRALVARDGTAALAAIDGALQAGRDPAGVGNALLSELRSVFLATMRADLSHLPDAERDRAQAMAADMPPARVTRAIEVLGTAIVEMRQAPDPRVDLEVAVMRLTRRDLDVSVEALLERIEALEAGAPRGPAAAGGVSGGGAAPAAAPVADAGQAAAPSGPAPEAPAAPTAPADERDGHDGGAEAVAPAAAPPASPAPSAGRRGADMARAILAEQQAAKSGGAAATAQAPAKAAEPAPAAAPPPAQAPAGDPTGPHADAPAEAPKTLADRRRQRQADAASGQSAAQANPAQSAADAPVAQQPESAPVPGVEALAAPVEPPPAPVEPPPGTAPPPAAQPESPADAPTATTAAPTEPSVPPAGSTAGGHAPTPANEAASATEPSATAPASPSPPPSRAPSAGLPAVGQLEAAWRGGMLESMSGRVRSRFSAGRFMPNEGDTAVFGLPNPVHRDRCEEVRAEVDAALAAHFGAPVPLTLVVDTAEVEPDIFATPPASAASPADDGPPPIEEEEAVDLDALVDADDQVSMTGVERVMATFEGSTLLQDPSTNDDDGR